jgi:hypothetical protein
MSTDQSASYDWVDDLINNFSEEFDPTSNRKLQLESLQDGEYTVQVVDANLDRIQSTGAAVLRWTLKILEGSSCQNGLVEKVNFFASQAGVNALGADLQILGINCKAWKDQGIPLGRGIVESLPKLIGVVFVGRKRTSTNQTNGKVYHNLNVLSVKKSAKQANDDEGTPF